MCGWKRMAKDVGRQSVKSIVLFLPCLVTFLGFRTYMVQIFFL